MHPPGTQARCALHLLLVDHDDARPDPSGLLAVLGDSAAAVTVAVWVTDDEPDPVTVRRAADLADDVEHLIGARPRYREVAGDPAAVIRSVTCDGIGGHPATRRSIIAVSADAPRRLVRSLRRQVAQAGAHLALLPHRPTRPTGA